MNTRIHEALQGKENNYILPFFWQHGEEEETLRTYMKVIQNMGIQAVCLESRPHPDYAGPQWWKDMDVILDEARSRNMKVWILDDCHFPTGYANGAMENAPESLQKQTIYHLMTDLAGSTDIRVDVGALLSDLAVGFPLTSDSPLGKKKELLCAVLFKRSSDDSQALSCEYEDVTDSIENGLLPLHVPEGFYRLFLVYRSVNAGLANNSYINLLQKESVKILLDAVYEPHYQRYAEEFGKTIAGFFSDEPGFYNCIDTVFNFDAIIGRQLMPLPWSQELESELLSDGFEYGDLIRLWYETDSVKDSAFRQRYMDKVTKLYEKNFSLQLGEWCREHQVEYIGHILEDNNSSSRLGPSAGHYFRAMKGQDMSGIDVVTNQILPGRTNCHTTNAMLNTKSDGEFYHYALAKLGASDAHTDLSKKGRAMCEIYGNYGWAEGAQLMKWLTDFMLVRGINVFVPHAFSPKEFPDIDCPPHFYAHGNNLQSDYLGYLFRYLNRISHILSGGKSASHIGILYHAEAEWSGEAMLFQKPGRICLEHQADYDVISIDRLLEEDVLLLPENTRTAGNMSCANQAARQLRVGGLTLSCLLIPYSEKLPFAFLNKLSQLGESGFPVIFLDALPAAASSGEDCSDLLDHLQRNALVLPLRMLEKYLQDNGLPILTFSSGKTYRDLRAYQYEGQGYQCVMLMNEHISSPVHDKARFSDFHPSAEYDAYENCLYIPELEKDELNIDLEPGEARIFLSGILPDETAQTSHRPHYTVRKKLTGKLSLSAAATPNKEQFRPVTVLDKPEDLSLRKEFRSFHGILRYELSFTCDSSCDSLKEACIYLDGANEIVSVSVNGSKPVTRIGTPYRFPVGSHLKNGVNHLVIDNVTTVFPYIKDHPSINTPLHPMGLCGDVWLEMGEASI